MQEMSSAGGIVICSEQNDQITHLY